MDKDEPPEWLRQAAQNADALIRSSWPIILAAQEYMEQARTAQGKARPILASGAAVALALDAGIAELAAAVRRQSPPRHHTASAHLTTTFMVVAVTEVAAATESLTVTVEVGSEMASARPVEIVILARLLLLLIALVLPLAETRLSQEEHQILTDYITTFGAWLPAELWLRGRSKR